MPEELRYIRSPEEEALVAASENNMLFGGMPTLLNDSEQDIQEANEVFKLLQQKIKQLKPREINMNPINNEIRIKDTTIKWKLKPIPFKILSRALFGGDVNKALLDTKFSIEVKYNADDSATLFLNISGKLRDIEEAGNPNLDHGGVNMQFGGILRF